MTIGIRITGYNSREGRLRTYEFHVSNPIAVTGNEDHFDYGMQQARAIRLGLQALDPLSTFEIREVNCDSHGGGTQIDGKDLSLIEMEMKEAIERDRQVAARRDK